MFEVKISPSIDKGKISLRTSGEFEFIGRSRVNNGIQGYTNKLSYEPNKSKTFSVSQVGTIVAQFRQKRWYSSQNIFILSVKHDTEIINNWLYILSSLNKALQRFDGGYSNYPTKSSLSNLQLTLPIKSDGTIAFDYMEAYIKELEAERIKELEAERIKELEAYLVATGLDDYVLSDEEEKLINNFKSDNVKWGEFNITDIFTVTNTHTILKNDIIPNSGDFPYITAGEGDNAVSTYISYDQNKLEKGNSIMIGGKTMVITYQPSKYFSNDSHNLSLVMKKNTNRDKLTQLFLVTALKTSLGSKYEWGNSISNKKIQSDIVMLPINSDGLPDYQLMNEYMKVLQKIIIKAVVEWKDQKIKATRKVVSKNNVD